MTNRLRTRILQKITENILISLVICLGSPISLAFTPAYSAPGSAFHANDKAFLNTSITPAASLGEFYPIETKLPMVTGRMDNFHSSVKCLISVPGEVVPGTIPTSYSHVSYGIMESSDLQFYFMIGIFANAIPISPYTQKTAKQIYSSRIHFFKISLSAI